MTFLIVWLAFCAVVFSMAWCGINYDMVAVFVLRALNVNACVAARVLAGTIYRHPEQWTMNVVSLEHPTIGKISGASSEYPMSIEVEGAGFGRWRPSAIEKRIIFDAVKWYQRVYIRSLVSAAMERTP